MQIGDSIKPCLDYIEQNLKTDITTEELAEIAGYSVWHFCRVFAEKTGMTVAYYICKRRISAAFGEIAGGRRATDAALDCGFDTYAGFYKAFCRMYGCPPKQFLMKYGKNLITGNGGNRVITEREIREALASWDIPQDLQPEDIYIMDGAKVAGNVWRLGDGLILKSGERDKVLKDLQLHKALARQGFNSASPVPTKSGAEYLDGERIYVLMRKLPGIPLGKEERFGDKRYDYAFKYGVAIARLHNALSEIEADIMPDEMNLFARITEWSLPQVMAQNEQYKMGLGESFFEDYKQGFGAVFDRLPKQFVHRDPNPSNIMFDGGEVSGFIDFELSERNIRLWDPCYCATGILSEWRGVDNIYEKWHEILKGILHGYDSVNPLTSEEKGALFYVICSIEIICCAWFNVQEGEGFHELAKTNREMLCYIADSRDFIDTIF